MPRNGRFTALLVGREGIGRGTLARITAARIQHAQRKQRQALGRYFVVSEAQLGSRAEFADFLDSLLPGDIVFVEELTALLDTVGAEGLLSIFEEPAPAPTETEVDCGYLHADPTVSWICCTRAPAKLGGRQSPLRSVLRPEIRLRDPTPEVITEILHDREMSIHPDAAYEIALYSAPHPAGALALYDEAREFALAEAFPMILPGHVRDAVEIMGVGSG